jgi:hypothetical protein
MPSCFSERISSRNSRVGCGSRPPVGSSRIAIHQNLGDGEPLAHAARIGFDGLARDLAEADTTERGVDARLDLAGRYARQPRGVAQVHHAREIVVETDLVGHVADAALDLERLAQRIEARDAGAPRCRLGQAEQHQDGGGLAGAVRAEQSEHFALFDRKVEMIDRDRPAIGLGELLGNDDRVAHRRPNLPTAPTRTRSAAPMTPTPAIPHSVDVVTETR